MTREEAIKRLEWLEMVAEYVDSVTIGSKCTEDWNAYNMAIAALREQEERSKAESEGRVIVLPCKVGDTVYKIVTRSTLEV